jgi:hypothetical protein
MRILICALLLLGSGACGSGASGSGSATVDMTTLARGGDGGLLALGAMCNSDGQCASSICTPYKMGAYKLCSLKCTALMPAPQCTSPGDGSCNGMGYCRFPGM